MNVRFYHNEDKDCDYVEIEIDRHNVVNRKVKDGDAKAHPYAWSQYQQEEVPEAAGIDTLGLSDRTVKALTDEGITTVQQLLGLTPGEIDKVPGIGPASLDEIAQALS